MKIVGTAHIRTTLIARVIYTPLNCLAYVQFGMHSVLCIILPCLHVKARASHAPPPMQVTAVFP